MARRTATTYRATRTTTTDGDEEVTDGGTTVVVEDKGLGLAEALAIGTTVLLVAAILVIDAYVGKRYGDGIFFH